MNVTCALPESVDAGGTAIVTTLIVLTPIPYLPQIYRLCRTKSSEGVSLATNVLTVLLTATNSSAAILVKAKQIKICASIGIACIPALLDGVQLFALAFASTAVLGLQVCYPPLHTLKSRAIGGSAVVATACLWAVCAAIDAIAPCGRGAITFASVLAWFGAACALVQYTPQLVTTWRQKGSGSLSPAFYLLQAVGGYIIFVDQAFFSRDPYPVWGPMLVSTTLQLIVALLAIAFDCRARTSRRGGTVPLLAEGMSAVPQPSVM